MGPSILAPREIPRSVANVFKHAKFVKQHQACLKKLATELNCACRATDDARSPLSAFAEGTVKPTLGQYLASIRHDRKMSLRQVEETSNKEVSNAYLSQLETGKIVQPSPNVLNTLSEIYEIDYVQLMELAGYLSPSAAREATQRHGRLATFAEHNLTPEEEGALMKYLKFLRMEQPP